MKYFDKDFLKFSFQFLLMIFLGVAVIIYVSGLSPDGGVVAGVIDGQ